MKVQPEAAMMSFYYMWPPPQLRYEDLWAAIASKLPADPFVTLEIIEEELRNIRSLNLSQNKLEAKAFKIYGKIQERYIFRSTLVDFDR